MIDRRSTARTLPARRRPARGVGVAVLAALTAFGGCYTNNDGNAPDDTRIYYPTALAMSLTGNHIFVINSDFDLAFNQGTVQAMDAQQIAKDAFACEALLASARAAGQADHPCKDYGVQPVAATSASPTTAQSSYVQAAVQIGAFAADVQSTRRYTYTPGVSWSPTSEGRLLIPERGNATLTYIDYDETTGGGANPITLDCGGASSAVSKPNGGRCDPSHEVGDDANEDSRDITLEGEPFAIATSPTVSAATDVDTNGGIGGIAAFAHQSTGDVSVFVNVLDADNTAPKLAYTVDGLAADATDIAVAYIGSDSDFPNPPGTPTFFVTNRTAAAVYVVNFYDNISQPDRSGLTVAYAVPIPTNSPGTDTRGIVIDPPNDGEPQRATRVFLSSRAPGSLVTGEIDPTTRLLHFFDTLALPVGPSRIVKTTKPCTAPQIGTCSHLYILSFDSRSIVSYDPDRRSVDNVIHTGRGPYSFIVGSATDASGSAHAVGYLADFTDMTVQVLDLEGSLLTNPFFEQIIYTIGIPQGPSH